MKNKRVNKKQSKGLGTLKQMYKNRKREYVFEVGDIVEPFDEKATKSRADNCKGMLFKVVDRNHKYYTFKALTTTSLNGEFHPRATPFRVAVQNEKILACRKINYELYKALYKELEDIKD